MRQRRDDTPQRPSHRTWLILILTLAAVLRLAHWAAVRDAPFVADPVVDSAEYDRWAREIAAGNWLGEGTFFQAPLYPYLLAGVYSLFGRHLDLVYLLQIALAVAGCWALSRAGRRLAGAGTGLAAAALAAAYGPFIFHDVLLLKESTAVTTVSFLLWALLVARDRAGFAPWLICGLLCGGLALLRENALLVAPLLALAALGAPREPSIGQGGEATAAPVGSAWRRFATAAAGLGLGMGLILAPVAVRNGVVGGSFLPTTYQGGVNFYIGNNPAADGAYRPLVAGRQIPAFERTEPVRLAEADLGRPLSPGEVSRYWLGRSLRWAREEPGDFLRLQLRKLRLFWSWYEWPDAVDYYDFRRRSPALRLPLLGMGGAVLLACLGLWIERRRPARWLPVLLWLGGWTAATVIFFLFSRYRLPALPALLLLAAVPAARVASLWSSRRRTAALGLAVAGVLAWALPGLAGYAPREDLVEYNLGRLAQDRGRTAEAAEHYRRAAELHPEDFLAPLNLGTLAARRGDLREALGWFLAAEAKAPASVEVQASLGGTYMALGDPESARRHLDLALDLEPDHPAALMNRALLALSEGDRDTAARLHQRLRRIDPDAPTTRRLGARLESLRPQAEPP